MNYRRAVPNSISGLSLVLGVLSIFLTFEGNFKKAAIFIILAVVADSMDGRAARLLKCQGEFGVQLDSLCDLCSFGVAPAILIYMYGLQELGLVGQIVASLFTFFGAMRLARFNVDSTVVHGYFCGMPIPAGAGVVATYVLSGAKFSPCLVAIGTFVVALIMYSTVRYPDFKGKGNPLFKLPVIVALIIGALMLFRDFSTWIFVIMFTYTIMGLINEIYARVLHLRDNE